MIAERLGVPPEDLKKKLSATDYWRWQRRFEEELNEPKPDHFYLAQLASEIACLPYMVWGKPPPEGLRDIKSWMLKFGAPEKIVEQAEEASEERQKQRAAFSQSTWMNWAGINEKGELTRPLEVRYPPGYTPPSEPPPVSVDPDRKPYVSPVPGDKTQPVKPKKPRVRTEQRNRG